MPFFWVGCGWEKLGERIPCWARQHAVLHGRRISFFSFSLFFPLSLFCPEICFLNLKNGAGWRVVGEVFGSTVTKLSSFLL